MDSDCIKIISCLVGGLIVLHLILQVLPYLVLLLALAGGWLLWQEYRR